MLRRGPWRRCLSDGRRNSRRFPACRMIDARGLSALRGEVGTAAIQLARSRLGDLVLFVAFVRDQRFLALPIPRQLLLLGFARAGRDRLLVFARFHAGRVRRFERLHLTREGRAVAPPLLATGAASTGIPLPGGFSRRRRRSPRAAPADCAMQVSSSPNDAAPSARARSARGESNRLPLRICEERAPLPAARGRQHRAAEVAKPKRLRRARRLSCSRAGSRAPRARRP